jgi:hypothetical protein
LGTSMLILDNKWKPGRWVISAPERLSHDQIRELKL